MEYLGHTYIKTFIIYLKFKFNWAFYVSSCLPPPTSPAFCQACPLAFTKCTENSLLILCPLWLAKKRYKESTRAFVFLGATLCLIMAELVSTSSSYSSLSPQALLCKGGPYPSSIPQHFKKDFWTSGMNLPNESGSMFLRMLSNTAPSGVPPRAPVTGRHRVLVQSYLKEMQCEPWI